MKKVKDWFKNVYSKIKTFFIGVDEGIDKGVNKVTSKFAKFWSKYNFVVYLGVFTLLALVLKYVLVPIPSWDYISFIQTWTYDIKIEGGFIKGLIALYEKPESVTLYFGDFGKSMGLPNCDYPPLYMYFLSIFSILPFGRVVEASGSWNAYYYYENLMYYVKTLTFIFEIIFAVFAYKIVKKVSGSKIAGCTAYSLFLFLPTVIINGAVWGQCDICYSTMLLISTYYLMEKKQIRSMVFFGLGLAFKLQVVFLLPLFGFVWFRKSFKLRYFLIAFGITILTFVPLWIGGAQFTTPFIPYGRQAGGYTSSINLNSTNIYTFFVFNDQAYNNSTKLLSTFGMILTVLSSFVLISLLAFKRVKVTPKSILLIATFSAVMVPFVMPHMHERYFYLAETLLLLYACTKINRIHLPIIQQVSGLIAYSCYGIIKPNWFLEDTNSKQIALCIGTFLNMIVLGFLIYDLSKLEVEPKIDRNELAQLEVDLQDERESNKKEA